MRKLESIYADIQRVRKNGPREPLRTLTELGEKLGMPANKLGRMMALPGAPQPAINNRTKAVTNRVKWYVPSEVKRWVKSLETDQA